MLFVVARNELYGFQMAIHTGTHMDAPCHFIEDGQRQHEVPLERFFGPAAVMDCKAQVDEDNDYEFSMEDLQAWEKENGKVPEGAYVLVCASSFALSFVTHLFGYTVLIIVC